MMEIFGYISIGVFSIIFLIVFYIIGNYDTVILRIRGKPDDID